MMHAEELEHSWPEDSGPDPSQQTDDQWWADYEKGEHKMAKWQDVLPDEGKHLKSEDIGDRTVRVTVARVDVQEFKEKDGATKMKPVLYFEGKEKGMVMNITNCRAMGKAFGDDMEGWRGASLELFTVETEMGPGLRVRKFNADDPDDPIPF